jgi:hypothetical protein
MCVGAKPRINTNRNGARRILAEPSSIALER